MPVVPQAGLATGRSLAEMMNQDALSRRAMALDLIRQNEIKRARRQKVMQALLAEMREKHAAEKAEKKKTPWGELIGSAIGGGGAALIPGAGPIMAQLPIIGTGVKVGGQIGGMFDRSPGGISNQIGGSLTSLGDVLDMVPNIAYSPSSPHEQVAYPGG